MEVKNWLLIAPHSAPFTFSWKTFCSARFSIPTIGYFCEANQFTSVAFGFPPTQPDEARVNGHVFRMQRNGRAEAR